MQGPQKAVLRPLFYREIKLELTNDNLRIATICQQWPLFLGPILTKC